MIRAWKAFWSSIAAELDRHASELRTGVTLIEAVAADGFETNLRALTGHDADEYREIALDAAKLGMTPETAREAFAQWAATPHRLRYELEGIRRHVEGRIKANE